MSEAITEKNTSSKTRSNMDAYFKSHDMQYVAEDAVFVNMSTGEKTVGREAISQMLHFIYHVAFDAHLEIFNTVVAEDKALLEANFKGKHIGELSGFPATNKEVNVPLCVSYDLENSLIKTARIYMLESVMMKQLGA